MKALIKTVLVTCLMLGGAAATQTASAGDLIIRIGNSGGYHAQHGHRAMPRVAHPRRAYVRPAPPRVVYVRPAPPRHVVQRAPPKRVVYVRPAPPRYAHPRHVRWGGHHGRHGGCSRC
jgi:hypothetical protein